MKEILGLIAAILFIGFMTIGGFNRNFSEEEIKSTWEKQGFQFVANEGFQFGMGLRFTPYGGANVWQMLKKIPDNGITYSGHLQRWGNEIQVYGPDAHDAIRPR